LEKYQSKSTSDARFRDDVVQARLLAIAEVKAATEQEMQKIRSKYTGNNATQRTVSDVLGELSECLRQMYDSIAGDWKGNASQAANGLGSGICTVESHHRQTPKSSSKGAAALTGPHVKVETTQTKAQSIGGTNGDGQKCSPKYDCEYPKSSFRCVASISVSKHTTTTSYQSTNIVNTPQYSSNHGSETCPYNNTCTELLWKPHSRHASLTQQTVNPRVFVYDPTSQTLGLAVESSVMLHERRAREQNFVGTGALFDDDLLLREVPPLTSFFQEVDEDHGWEVEFTKFLDERSMVMDWGSDDEMLNS
jgi:hypothetical protein